MTGERRRILVVDDEALVRDLLGAALGSEGYEVAYAGTGEEAERAIGHGTAVDLVILDWRMPGVSGAGVLRAIAAMERKPPVILLTGALDEELEEMEGIGARPRVVLRKPIRLNDLFSAVASVLSEKP